MRTGMLWFDNDSETDLPSKVMRAAAYYQKKYGCSPNLCFVNPGMLEMQDYQAAGIELRPSSQVEMDHFWLGMNDRVAA